MKKIKPISQSGDKDNKYFNPFYNRFTTNGLKMVCCCGYELIKESENTFKCVGGNHRYIIDDGSFNLDKYGNVMLKIPDDVEKNIKNEDKKQDE